MRFQCFGWRRSTMSSRCFGERDLTPSTPAVFLPWLSWVTRRTARSLAASDFINSFCSFLNCPCITTFAGLIDSLLDAVHMLLELTPGQRAPSLTLRLGVTFSPGAFLSAI